jgi:hypothetical protein
MSTVNINQGFLGEAKAFLLDMDGTFSFVTGFFQRLELLVLNRT